MTGAEKLKQFRKHLDLTQEAFATMLGIPQSTYANYESGTREAPYKVLRLLARMGLNLNWYCADQGDMLGSEAPGPVPAGGYPKDVISSAVKVVQSAIGARPVLPSAVAGSVLYACQQLTRGVSPETLEASFRLGIEMRDAEVSGVPLRPVQSPGNREK